MPLLIVTKLEQYQYGEATALAVVMLAGVLRHAAAGEPLQAWSRGRGPQWLALVPGIVEISPEVRRRARVRTITEPAYVR